MTLDPRHYSAPATHAAERALFRREWILLDALETLPVGHATSRTVHGVPYLLWHTEQGLSAFVNICPHRGGPLIEDGHTERCPRLRCRYHGWQFGSDGALLRSPGFGGDPGAHGLRPVHTRIWRGLVFASLDPSTTLDARLEALAGAPDWSDHGSPIARRHELACNWKTYVENYLEGYHIPYLHPGLTAEIEMSSYTVLAADGVALHHVRAREAAMNRGFWAWIWPNAALNVYEGGICVERVVPISPVRCAVEYTYLFAPGVDEATRAQLVAQSARTTAEDIGICETVQRNLETGLYTPGPLSPQHEQGIAHFHALLEPHLPG